MLLSMALLWGAPTVPDGTLLFLENSNQFVALYTGSKTTHVAVVINHDRQPWVYEATPHEVRKLPLADYYAELGKLNERRKAGNKIRVWKAEPRATYSARQVQAMRTLLDTQLRRRYSIKGYVRGESDGVHCAELAALTLCASSALDIERCQDQSPAMLLERVRPLSRPMTVVAIDEPQTSESWYTRSCNEWPAYSNWCRWSCWETWTFCW